MSLLLDVSDLEHEVGQERRFELLGPAPEAMALDGASLGPIRVTGRALWTGETVLVEGVAKAVATLVCGRCLEPFAVDLQAEFSREYREESPGPDGREGHRGPAAIEGPIRDRRKRRSAGKRRTAAEAENEHEPEGEALAREEPLTYRNDRLDLSFPSWEALALEVPMKPVCREECRGLCPVCGTNLNKNTCGCEAQRADPRFLSLKKLLEEKERGD